MEIKVRKIISTRYNLLEGEFANRFSMLSPSIEIDGKEEVLPANKVTGVIIENQKGLPTKEELDESTKFINREDVYRFSNGQTLTPS